MFVSSDPKSLPELIYQLDSQKITGYKRYEAVRSYLGFKAREKGIPLHGTFELTPLCNLDCKMCYVHLAPDQLQGKKLLSVDQWKQLMDEAIAAGMMYATLTGGECLTYPGFKDLYLYHQSRGIEVSILTNGLLIDEDMLEFFREHAPAIIQITMYGIDDDGYESVTGRRCFDTFERNILRVKESGLPLRVSITPNEFTRKAEEMVRWLKDHGIAYIINPSILKPRTETGRTLHPYGEDEYIALVKEQQKIEGKREFNSADPDDLPDTKKTGKSVKGVRCGAGRSSFSVSWDGVMRPCNVFPDIEARPLVDGFTNAWNHINTEANCFPIPVECVDCSYEKVCTHCIPMHAAGAEIGHANPSICSLGKRMVCEGIFEL